MTARYTPAFSDIYSGTLYGKWPAAAVWASLLPLFDRNGELDMSYQALSGMIGWPIDLLKQGIAQLMEPDPDSRSPDRDGRRLVPLCEGRDWGWIAVNHAKHTERARLKAKNEREVESGQNRERLRAVPPPATAGDRRPPPETASPSGTGAGARTGVQDLTRETRVRAREGELPGPEFSRLMLAVREAYPPGLYRDHDWLLAEKRLWDLVGEVATEQILDCVRAFALQQSAKGSAGTQFVLSPAKFFAGNTWRGPFPLPKTKADQRLDTNIAAGHDFLRATEATA